MMMKIGGRSALAVMALLVAFAPASEASEIWEGYLDYAYVYSSADPATLKQRLVEYGEDAGSPLERYVSENLGPTVDNDSLEEDAQRRKAIAHLLFYLAHGDTESLSTSVEAARGLEKRLDRHENHYWYHYILAHQALERGRSEDFVSAVLELWMGVVVPLEIHFESLQALSLNESPRAGFAASIPYLHENVARLVLIRSQEMGLREGLDPLASIVRLLDDGRVGAHPEVIPRAASSRDYVDRIVERLDGPESDSGSLTFTLALFEAGKAHDRARGLLASEGLGPATLEAMRVTTGAYTAAFQRAYTLQGRCAVYTRGLRQLGEVYAAKQRLGVDAEIDTPVTIEGAIQTYRKLHEARETRWQQVGYVNTGRQSYIDAMHGLWEEIQEAVLNAADYHLATSQHDPDGADDHSRDAARLYARYLSFFLEYANAEDRETVPDSAYFAAHEAAKGVGDAYVFYAHRPTGEEIDLAVQRYRGAMSLFPFDRDVWSSLAAALERQGREGTYMKLIQASADAISQSRTVDRWIKAQEPGARQIQSLRRALSDSSALLYMGFADGNSAENLEQNIADLRKKRETLRTRLAQLRSERDALWTATPDWMGDAIAEASGRGTPSAAEELNRRIAEDTGHLDRMDRLIATRAHVLPIYKDTLESEALAQAIRSRRDHPVHALLRRMYYEIRS